MSRQMEFRNEDTGLFEVVLAFLSFCEIQPEGDQTATLCSVATSRLGLCFHWMFVIVITPDFLPSGSEAESPGRPCADMIDVGQLWL